ncbi:hypothetical protein P5673_031531 [Acropora cervicornis]|uniref:Uncharacterized protein n=1 Tax=Acropora cervicornis TaxID=6130 RepID=A0AAD9USF7_ACRCE|nr:hypothetical protein P5673_031531 [Acropora cervicornis]
MGKNKSECDREMVKSLDEIPYGEMPKWGQTARFIINATQKLGLGWFGWYFVKATLNHFVTLVGTRALYHGLGEIQRSSASCSMQFCTDAENVNQQGSPLSHCLGFIDGTVCRDARAVNKISIPLNVFNYFAAVKNIIHPNIKMSILLKLENDNNIIFRKAANINRNKETKKHFNLGC